jgi:hypothetical protein
MRKVQLPLSQPTFSYCLLQRPQRRGHLGGGPVVGGARYQSRYAPNRRAGTAAAFVLCAAAAAAIDTAFGSCRRCSASSKERACNGTWATASRSEAPRSTALSVCRRCRHGTVASAIATCMHANVILRRRCSARYRLTLMQWLCNADFSGANPYVLSFPALQFCNNRSGTSVSTRSSLVCTTR